MSTFKTNRVCRVGLVTLALIGPLAGLVCWSGCRRSDATATVGATDATQAPVHEDAWADQLARVKAGQSDQIKLEQTPVGPDQLAKLSGLSSLKTLILDAGQVRDEDVHYLEGLSGLEHLRLRNSPLSDAGFEELRACQLDSLVILNLPQATPSADGMRMLRELPHLRQLRTGGRQFDDAALEELTHWPALTSLHLIAPSLSDQALETIARMPNLSSFYLDDCPLSDPAWEKLFQARPTLHVHIDQFHHDRDPRGEH